MCLYETKEETYATVALMVQEGLCASMEPTSMWNEASATGKLTHQELT